MALRVTLKEGEALTVIRVDGRLAGDGVAELDRACRDARRPVVLDLADMITADSTGLLLLRRLAGDGVPLLGASRFTTLLLSGPAPGSESTSRRPPGRGKRPRLGSGPSRKRP